MRQKLLVIAVIAVIAFAAWSYFSGGIISTMLRPGTHSETRVQEIQKYFETWGAAAPLGYMLLVVVEVILAPIPGAVLYLPGGVIFGWLLGGSLSLAGNVVGAGLACRIMRSLVRPYIEPYLESSALKKYSAILEQRGVQIVFVLRVNPITSSDLISYAAGLTGLPVWKVMTGTLLGMAPLCFLQAYFAQELFTVFPGLIYPMVLFGILYALYVVKILSSLLHKSRTDTLREPTAQ